MSSDVEKSHMPSVCDEDDTKILPKVFDSPRKGEWSGLTIQSAHFPSSGLFNAAKFPRHTHNNTTS